NYFRSDLFDRSRQGLEASNVALDFTRKRVRFDNFMEVWVRRGRQTDTPNGGTELFRPERNPPTFKAGMAGYENPFALVDAVEHLPDFPSRLATIPHIGQKLLLSVGVHTLPEPGVHESGDLALSGQTIEWLLFQHALVAAQVAVNPFV